MSLLMVVNPSAGRGRARRTARAVADGLRARGCSVTIRQTGQSGDAERMTRDVLGDADRRPDCVVACGGDGTIQEIANALAAATGSHGVRFTTMGLAPAGRCNDFARALGISADPGAITEVLAGGKPYGVDLGKVNDRYFCTVATLGVDAEVSGYVDAMRVPLTGTAAYLYGALCTLARYRPRPLRIAGEFGVIEQPVFLASTANTPSYGGSIPIAPDADPTDGLLDLCVIDPVSRFRALRLLPIVVAGRHRLFPGVHFHRTRRLRIDANEPLELWADGERIGRTPVTIAVAPGAVQVMLPGHPSHG